MKMESTDKVNEYPAVNEKISNLSALQLFNTLYSLLWQDKHKQ